jgi:hypothetical protein
MNCPNCGAENEPEVRFCVECGTPLESQAVPLSIEDDDANDRTILSSMPLVAEEAKTVAVSSDDVLSAVGEPDIVVESFSDRPAVEESGPAYGSVDAAPLGGDVAPPKKRNYLLIAIVAFIVLCCCCGASAIGFMAASGALEEIMYELGVMLPVIIQPLA